MLIPTKMAQGAGVPAEAKSTGEPLVFTFGEPEAVLDKRELFDMFETTRNSRWFEPPIPMVALGKTYHMAAQHQAAIVLKMNLLSGAFVPSRWLGRAEFAKWALDWLIFGNAYLERIDNLGGRPMQLLRSPAAFTRVGVKPGAFWFVRGGEWLTGSHEFAPGTVFHLVEPDPLQEVYGRPQYLGALQAGLLNEAATIFRRRYFKNGSHAGYILYVSEEGFSEADSNATRQALRDAKGPGNFRNLYMHIPKGKKEGVQIIPIGEAAAKDEFLNIKEITRDDLLAAHRMPPQLLGIVPKNASGFGNVVDAGRTFYELEILPIQNRMLEVNDWLGMEAVKFATLADQGILQAIPKTTPAK